MPRALSEDATRALRLRSQRLSGPPETAVARLVGSLGAIQSQDPVAAALAVRARTSGLDAAAVDRARDEERSVVWTWALRGTLQLVAAEDVGWMLGLLGPIFAAAGRRRRIALGLTDDLCERSLAQLPAILAERGPLERGEIVERLAARGVTIDAAGQAPAHLLAYAALRGVVCRIGPAAAPRYASLEAWLGRAPAARDPDDALAELARRHLGAHGPATADDLAAWSGIGLRRARRALGLLTGELRPVQTATGAAWMLAGSSPRSPPRRRPHVALLGHFDPYLLGYADRDLVLDRRFAARIQAGGGFVQPAMLADGRVVGTWRRPSRGTRLELQPFAALPEEVRARFDREAADVTRFLGSPAP